MWEGEVRHFASLDSTNAYLLRRARDGAPAGLVAVADHQDAGRGRLGRRWESPAGSGLLMSVLVRPVLAPDDLYLCTGACALALSEACMGLAGVRTRVKWPNDLVVGDAKLAGILAESDPSAPGGEPGSVAVVVGVGCNLSWPGPPGSGGTSLEEAAGRPVGRDDLLDATLDALARRLDALENPRGREELLVALRQASATLGRRVRVDLPAGVSVEGEAVALGEGGRLVVRTADGEVVVSAGDVVHLRALPGPGPATTQAGGWTKA